VSYIVSLDELREYLGDAPVADDALLEALLDGVEALYARATGREVGWYIDQRVGVTEVLDGTGSKRLYLPYPVAAITSISLGYNAAAPDEALNLSDPASVVYGVGSRVVTRTDGGGFGKSGQPRYVHVVYDHLGNVPEDAKLPIMEVVAAIYRGRGSEGMKSETIGDYSYSRGDLESATATNMLWQLSVDANRAVGIG
jgi:hypothetical protein